MEHGTHNFLQPGGQTAISDRMRELLARAAQDNVYEQRTQGAALDEIRQRLEGLEWLLRDVRERELGGLSNGLDALTAHLDEVAGQAPDWAKDLAGTVETLGESVKPVAELPSLWADVGTVAERVDDAIGRLQAIADSSQQHLKTLEGFTKRLDKLQGAMDGAASRFTRLEKSLTDLTARTQSVQSGVAAITERFDETLGETAEQVTQALEAMTGRVEGFTGRLDGLDGRLEGLQGRLGGLEGKWDGVDDRLEAVNERLTQLPATLEITKLQQGLADLAERPAIDHSDRFDQLDKQLSDAASVIEPLLEEVRARPDRGELESAFTKVVEGAREDMTRRLNALEETMLALAEALLRPATKTGKQRQKAD